MQQVNLQHVFLLGGLLAYIGRCRGAARKEAYVALGTMAAMIPFIVRHPKGSGKYYDFVLLAHYLVMLPALAYVAWNGYKGTLDSSLYTPLLYLGLFVSGYHIWLFVQKNST